MYNIYLPLLLIIMKKYLLISVSYRGLKRGAFTISERMVNEHSEYLDHLESKDVIDLRELNEKYKRIIFVTQTPSNYPFPINLVSLRGINYLIYVRSEFNHFGYNSCNNGFYYTHRHSNIRNFIPMITDFFIEPVKSDKPCLGFYIRNYLTRDSFDCFLGILSNLHTHVNIYTMGEDIKYNFSEKFEYVESHNHTFDNRTFFSNVTHYVYPESKFYIDPLPYSLIEAAQNGKEIIVPRIDGRHHRDGIDDIKDFITYHTRFIPGISYNNSVLPFSSLLFKKFYRNVFDNNFEHVLDRKKYNTFISWVVGEVL